MKFVEGIPILRLRLNNNSHGGLPQSLAEEEEVFSLTRVSFDFKVHGEDSDLLALR